MGRAPFALPPATVNRNGRFKRPLLYPDSLLVGVRTIMPPDAHDAHVVQHYKLLSRASGRIAAEGSATVVTFDYKAGACVLRVPLRFRASETPMAGRQKGTRARRVSPDGGKPGRTPDVRPRAAAR